MGLLNLTPWGSSSARPARTFDYSAFNLLIRFYPGFLNVIGFISERPQPRDFVDREEYPVASKIRGRSRRYPALAVIDHPPVHS